MPRRLFCPVLVLCCVDFRYVQPAISFVKRRFKIKACDVLVNPGGAKALLDPKPGIRKWMLKNIGMIRKGHGLKSVVLVHHQDCLAYGGARRFRHDAAEIGFHARQLAKARTVLASKFPTLDIQTFYVHKKRGAIRFKCVA